MGIREKEDILFTKWHKKYTSLSFVKDGCPNPTAYNSERRKVVFVLKDGNLGNPDAPGDIYDQRDELENYPTPWWSTVARWCYFLKHPSHSWLKAQTVICDEESIKTTLQYHCIVQLKKTWGTGKVANETLVQVVGNDKEEIIEQLSIYTPNFIIACGNGDQLSKLFNKNKNNRLETNAGIGYWKIDQINFNCYLIDFCHPSVRSGTKIKGLIAKGLTEAILEIENKPNS